MHAWRLSAASVTLAVAFAATAVAQIPLIDAVKRGDRAAVRTLLQQQADASANEPDGTTALHWAAQQDDPVQLSDAAEVAIGGVLGIGVSREVNVV